MVRSRRYLEEELTRVTPNSRSQWERGKQSMPGGVIKGAYWSPPHPIYMDRAEGCHMWDLDGRKYLDFEGHHTAMILGHNPKQVVDAVTNELGKGFGFGAPTSLEAEIAEEIISRVPSIEKIRFANSGTEASLHVTRLMRSVTGRHKIAKFEGAYHGSHDALEVSTAPTLDRVGPIESPKSVAAQDGMSRVSEEDVVVIPYNRPEYMEKILRQHRDELAGVFYDPKAGIYDIPYDFVRSVRSVTKDLDLLLVMDEIVSFRAGFSGYQCVSGVKPDLTVYGKIFGGGFPVGVIGGRADLMDLFDSSLETNKLGQSGTFSGNAFTLTAGLATLRCLTPEVYEHLNLLRSALHEGLVNVFNSAEIPCYVVSEGALLNLYITDQEVHDYREQSLADKELFDRIGLELLLNGYYGWGGLGLSLSLPMKLSHIDEFLDTMSSILSR